MVYSELCLMIELQRTTELQKELQNYYLTVENQRTIEVPQLFN